MTAAVTLVFIPGLVSDARVWRPVAEKLAPGLPTYFAEITSQDSIVAMAAGVLAQCDGDLIPVGHSLGGRVAMEMAHQAPDRVRALVLADTGHHPLAPGETEKREAKIAMGHADMAALCNDWLPPMVDAGRHDDQAVMDDLTDMVLAAGPDQHERQIRALMSRPDAAQYLPDVTCPVLLLVGRTDQWSPVAQHQEIADMVDDAELYVIDDAGHFLPFERPRETANVLSRWLSERGFLPE